MLYKEFDVLIDTIEENVTKSWEEIEDKLKTTLAMTAQDLSELFKYFYPRDITVNRYYKERKAILAMKEIRSLPKEPKDNIIDRFGYSDYSVFYKTIKKITGKNPQQIIDSNSFHLPDVLHLDDILKDVDYDINNQIRNRTNMYNYSCEKKALVERIVSSRKRAAALRRNFLDTKNPRKREEIMSKMEQLEEDLVKYRELLATYQHEAIYIKNLTIELYAEFIKIEDCRAIYGLSIEEIVDLYNDSIEKSVSLRDLCDTAEEVKFFCEEEYELEEARTEARRKRYEVYGIDYE